MSWLTGESRPSETPFSRRLFPLVVCGEIKVKVSSPPPKSQLAMIFVSRFNFHFNGTLPMIYNCHCQSGRFEMVPLTLGTVDCKEFSIKLQFIYPIWHLWRLISNRSNCTCFQMKPIFHVFKIKYSTKFLARRGVVLGNSSVLVKFRIPLSSRRHNSTIFTLPFVSIAYWDGDRLPVTWHLAAATVTQYFVFSGTYEIIILIIIMNFQGEIARAKKLSRPIAIAYLPESSSKQQPSDDAKVTRKEGKSATVK